MNEKSQIESSNMPFMMLFEERIENSASNVEAPTYEGVTRDPKTGIDSNDYDPG